MKISEQEVARVAQLARLDLDPSKSGLFSTHINAILDYMEKLGEVDTSRVDPLYTPVAHHTVLRPDEVLQEYTRDQILDNAPEEDGRYFIVPKIV